MEPEVTAGLEHHSRDGETVLSFTGAWTTGNYHRLPRALPAGVAPAAQLDFSRLGNLDTAGASRICRLVGVDAMARLLDRAPGLTDERKSLLLTVADSLAHYDEPKPARPDWLAPLETLGRRVVLGWHHLLILLGFTGRVLCLFAALMPRPGRWRFTSMVHHIQQTGLNAVPIVALLTFLVGAVVAFLGATVLNNFGAAIYTVDLVAYSFLREFGVLLTAILLAGRTASAFTAQLGSMKVNEEIDALRTLGLDPVEVLVLPRMLALLIIFPLLTFIAMVSGLVGGAMVALVSLDISLIRFVDIVEDVAVRHFWVGMSKAPVFAVVIALIGCLEGFKVKGTAQSVGEHTTSSVVQSIFFVILLDAVAALFCMEMGW